MVTYANLLLQIQSEAENDDSEFVTANDDFLDRAEDRIFRDAPLLPFFKAESTGSLGSGTATLSVPSGMRVVRAFSITVSGREIYLNHRTDSYLEDYWPNASLTDVPKFYTRQTDSSFKMAPTPDSAYSYTIKGRNFPTRLSGSNTTNWVSNNASDVLLYACMVEAENYLKHPEAAAVWEAKYNQGLATLQAEMGMTILNENSTGA